MFNKSRTISWASEVPSKRRGYSPNVTALDVLNPQERLCKNVITVSIDAEILNLSASFGSSFVTS